MRAVKSPLEIQCTREAAALSDRALRAGMRTAGVGVNEREVAADVYHSLVLGGSEYPGFAPLVRSAEMLFHEHVTWRDRVLVPGDCAVHGTVGVGSALPRAADALRLPRLGAGSDRGVRRRHHRGVWRRSARRSSRGPTTGEVYAKWQAVIDRALGEGVYGRHHCGYMVGIGFPPELDRVARTSSGCAAAATSRLKEGMVFHVLSWMLGQALPDYGVSDTVLVTADGGEILTSTGRRPTLLA
jgi:Xaa-Pro dipeptidase